MDSPNIKKELKLLIEQEKDPKVLEEVHSILKKSSLDPSLKEKLTARALKAEKDIREGKVMDRQRLENQIRRKFDL